MTQCEIILKHLKSQGSITPLEALASYGIMRLSARIDELRKSGHDINTDRETSGAGKTYARYRLVAQKPEQQRLCWT